MPDAKTTAEPLDQEAVLSPETAQASELPTDETPLVTELHVVDPRILRRREVNARYMEPHTFRRLVANIRRDGQLSAEVLAYQHDDGSLEIISGHHRTEAAIEAELKEVDVRVIVSRHTEERLTALQLSHNAISGKDNPAILEKMYTGLGLDWKKYSGLTDDDVTKFQDLKIDGLGAAGLKYEEFVLMFLPEDLAGMEACIKKVQSHAAKGGGSRIVHAATFDSFDAVFNTVIRVKHKLNIFNSALAIQRMAELAVERLEQIEAEMAAEEAAKAAEEAKAGLTAPADADPGSKRKGKADSKAAKSGAAA